jgi:hypothetical protein
MNRSIRRARLPRDRSGQAIVELALVMPILLLISLGLVEFGRALSVSHSLSRVGREGANIAARGTGLDTVLTVVLRNASDVELRRRGGVIVSRIEIDDAAPVISRQVVAPGFEGRSRLGSEGAIAKDFVPLGFERGSIHYAVELFYDYQTITPLPRFVTSLFPLELYDRAVF